MLVNLNDVLRIAEKRDIAIGSFNTPTLENIIAVTETAEKYGVPVILMHARLHEAVIPMKTIGPVMLELARRAAVPVCVHLDHCEELDYLYEALKMGFTSVMFDGSLLPYEENVEKTKKAVERAKLYGANVEGEIGVLGGREAGSGRSERKEENLYTDPYLAGQFVKETGIDALAASFGTAHGFYKQKPELDFDRIKTISELVQVPLVMHGGSGVSPEDYEEAIARGIRKVNYYSYMARAGVEGVKEYLKNREVFFYHELANAATEAMRADVDRAVSIFAKCSSQV